MAVLLTKNYQEISRVSLTYGDLIVYAKYSVQSREANTTTYQLKTVFSMTTYRDWSFSSATAYLDDVNKSYGYTTFYRGETLIQEITKTKVHNEDGSSPTIRFNAGLFASYGGGGETISEIVFPNIQRYAIATNGTNFTDEENPTLTFTNVGLYSLRAKIKVGNVEIYSEDLSDQTVTSYSYVLTEAQRVQLRQLCTGKSMTVALAICSVNDDTILYESTANVTMTVVNANPIFNHSEIELNENVVNVLGTDSANTIIQNASKVQITVSPVAYKESNIANVRLVHSGETQIKSENPYVFEIDVKSSSFNIIVTDTRGYTTEEIFTKQYIEYSPVKINKYSFVRENSTSSNIIVNLQANYIQENFGSISNVPVIKWKLDNGSYTTIPSSYYVIDTTNNIISLSNYVLTNVLPYTSKGSFSIEISDLLTEAIENDILVIKGIPTFDYGEHDLKVNGDLYVADVNGENAVNVLDKIDEVGEYSTYSTNEMVVGKWINGKPLYRKVVDLGNLTNNSSKTVSTGLYYSEDVITSLKGYAKNQSNPGFITLPMRDILFQITQSAGDLFINTSENYSNWKGWAIIEYYKTTD